MKIKDKLRSVPLEVKASIAYTLCNILQKCLAFITLPLFTRILSTEQYGQATIYSSWSNLIAIFITLNLPYGSFFKAMTKYENQRDEYIASVEGICLLLSALFLLIYLPFNNIWNVLFELPTFIICIMVFHILGNTFILFWTGKKRFEYKYKEVIAITLITVILTPILQFLLITKTEEKGYAKIIGGAIVSTLVGLIFFILNIIKVKKIFYKEFWKYALGFNIPLLMYYISQMIFNASDKIMISHMVGVDKAAIYGVAYSLAIVLNVLINAINNSYVPWFYEKMKSGKQRDNIEISIAIAILIAFLLLGVIWFSPEIIGILAGKKYLEAIWIVPPVSISTLLLLYSQFCISIEFFYEEKKSLAKSSIVSAIINIVLNATLIPVLGYYVAGYTTLVSYLCFVAFNYKSMKKTLKKNNVTESGLNITMLILIFILFTIASFIGMAMYNYFLIRLISTIVVFIILLLNRKIIKKCYKLYRGDGNV